jgi:hypothetical protein
MLSGTGVRDPVAGGYLYTDELGIPEALAHRIANWLAGYENAHYFNYKDKAEIARLDHEGIEIAKQLQNVLPEPLVDYYSNAELRRIPIV